MDHGFKNHDRPNQQHHRQRRILDSVVDDFFAQGVAKRNGFGAIRFNRGPRALAQIGNIDPNDNQDRLANQKHER